MNKNKISEEGKCPKCNTGNIQYGLFNMLDDGGYYEYHCPDCGSDGREWYKMTYLETIDNGERK